MACWYQRTDFTNTRTLMCIGASASVDSAFLTTNDTDGLIYAFSRNGGTLDSAISTAAGTSTGTWYLATGVWTSSTSRAAFYNGGSKGTNATAIVPTGLNQISVGARNRNATLDQYLDGLIAYPTVWNIALSDAEVAQLATNAPWLVRPDATIDYWKLANASPEPDSGTPGGIPLTIFNAAAYSASEPTVNLGGSGRLVGGSLVGGRLVA